jgi:hypothetical protein
MPIEGKSIGDAQSHLGNVFSCLQEEVDLHITPNTRRRISPSPPGFDDLRISPTSLQDVLPAIVGQFRNCLWCYI